MSESNLEDRAAIHDLAASLERLGVRRNGMVVAGCGMGRRSCRSRCRRSIRSSSLSSTTRTRGTGSPAVGSLGMRGGSALGRPGEATRFAASRDELRADVQASLRRVIASRDIDFIPGSADLSDFDATSTIAWGP